MRKTSNEAMWGRGITKPVAESTSQNTCSPVVQRRRGGVPERQTPRETAAKRLQGNKLSMLCLDSYPKMKMCCHIAISRRARWIGFISSDLSIYTMHLFLCLLLDLAAFLCGHMIQNSKRTKEAVRENETNGAERETERAERQRCLRDRSLLERKR